MSGMCASPCAAHMLRQPLGRPHAEGLNRLSPGYNLKAYD